MSDFLVESQQAEVRHPVQDRRLRRDGPSRVNHPRVEALGFPLDRIAVEVQPPVADWAWRGTMPRMLGIDGILPSRDGFVADRLDLRVDQDLEAARPAPRFRGWPWPPAR